MSTELFESDIEAIKQPPEPQIAEPGKVVYNAVQTRKVDFGKFNISEYTFSLPSVLRSSLQQKFLEASQLDEFKVETPQIKKLVEDINACVENYAAADLYTDRFTDESSKFHQGVVKGSGTEVIPPISSPKFKAFDGDLKGEIAVLKISKKLGLGDVFTVMLPHSGIVVTIKPPPEREIIDFYNSIFRDKVYLGRMTSGLTLSNFSSYINNKLFDFITSRVHSINYGDIPKEKLRDYVLIHDFPILAWGLAACMYPNGFEYQRNCVNIIEKCTHVVKDTINLLDLVWVDNPSLTEFQKDTLTEFRANKLGVDSYRKYLNDHTKVKSGELPLACGIKVKLKVPTFSEHIQDGLGWVNKINTAIDKVVCSADEEDKVKSDLLQQYVNASALRQYGHFIDYLEVDDNVITDRDTINTVLETLSSDDSIRKEILSGIVKYTSETTIAIIGIPEFKCEVCGKEQNVEPINEKLVSVIPLDVMMLFFTLLTLRLSRILERE